MIVVLLASAILLAAAEPASSPTPADDAKAAAAAAKTVDPAVATAKPKDDPMAMVCHSETPVGSRLPVKKCMTKGEAEMRKFDDRQALERAQGATYHW